MSATKAVKNLDPLLYGLARGTGVNKYIMGPVGKRLVTKQEGHFFTPEAKKVYKNTVGADQGALLQQELKNVAKSAYEGKGHLYVEGGKRMKDGKPVISFKDKLLYNVAKYGPTSLLIKAPLAGAVVAASNKVSPTQTSNPVKLPENFSD